jgi:hypothetical protein
MTDPTPPIDPQATPVPLPPPPPSRVRAGGCLKVVLIGIGVLVLLAVIFAVAAGIWFRRNQGQFQAGALEGARFGMVRDEAACFDEGKRRAAEITDMAGAFRVGPFVRACLEYSRQTEGFCENVPPGRSVGETAVWQQHRCGEDGVCKNVLTVVQSYCTDGRPKRQPADTTLITGG